MALTLSVIKAPAGISLPAQQRTFSEQGGTVGRGDGNDWVLSDPDRFLSSRHCGVSFESGHYYLTDLSTNGTFVNGAHEPVGKGGKIPLKNGDTVELGDYQFRVEVSAGGDAFDNAFEQGFDDPFAAPAAAGYFADPSPGLALEDPFAPVSGAGAQADPFASSGFAAGHIPLGPQEFDVDPLAALDKAGKSGGSGQAGFGHGAGPRALEGGSDPFADPFAPNLGPQADPFLGSTQGDGAGAGSQSLHWPEVKSESLIPDDWDDDDLMGNSASEALPAQPAPYHSASSHSSGAYSSASSTPRPQGAAAQGPLDLSQAHRSMPLTEPPQATPRRSNRPDSDLLAARAPERVNTFEASTPAPSARVSEPRVPRQEVARELGDALLSGMGLAEHNLDQAQLQDIYAQVGELMPVIVSGMMQVLRSRASIKNEFRMNVTTIQPIENNPLKFSADVHEAIENMFIRRSGAYKGAKEAFQEGFDGVGEHQVAIIAGIRAAFKSMMDRFNPDSLERQFDKHGKGVALPGMQKTKYWNGYIDYYKGFVDNMENSFQYLFGDEFVQAYEEQLRRLAAERKKRQ